MRSQNVTKLRYVFILQNNLRNASRVGILVWTFVHRNATEEYTTVPVISTDITNLLFMNFFVRLGVPAKAVYAHIRWYRLVYLSSLGVAGMRGRTQTPMDTTLIVKVSYSGGCVAPRKRGRQRTQKSRGKANAPRKWKGSINSFSVWWNQCSLRLAEVNQANQRTCTYLVQPSRQWDHTEMQRKNTSD